MDVIDALEHLGEGACWETLLASDGGRGHAQLIGPELAAALSSACDSPLLRALHGERLHVNVSPAEEEEGEGQGVPDEEVMPRPDGQQPA